MADTCSTSRHPSEIVEMHILWRVWPLYGASGENYATKIPIIGSCMAKLLASSEGPPSS